MSKVINSFSIIFILLSANISLASPAQLAPRIVKQSSSRQAMKKELIKKLLIDESRDDLECDTPSVNCVPEEFPTIQEAIDASSSGYTIQIAAGDYSTEDNGEVYPLVVDSLHALHFIGRDSGTPNLIGTEEQPSGIVILNSHSFTLENIQLTTSGVYASQTLTTASINVKDSFNATFNSLKISNSFGKGLHIDNYNGTSQDNLTIDLAYIANTEDEGLSINYVADTTVTNSYIVDTLSNGALACNFGNISVSDCVIRNTPYSEQEADGITLYLGESGEAAIQNSEIYGFKNSSNELFALTILGSSESSTSITNNIIRNNNIGIGSLGGNLSIINNTFYSHNNLTVGSYGSVTTIDSNIISGSDVAIENFENSAEIFARYNNIWNINQEFSGYIVHTNNIYRSPGFVDPEENDFHLQCGSFSIDRGNPGFAYSLEPENNGNRINQGAYGNTAEAMRSIQPDYCAEIAPQ